MIFFFFIISEILVRDIKYRRWKGAIKKCLNWDTCGTNGDDISYEDRGKFFRTPIA